MNNSPWPIHMVVSPLIMWHLLTVYLTDNYLCTFSITPNELTKTLRRIICLEMLRAVSVTKSSQLKITYVSCGKLWKPLIDIPWHNFTLEKTVTKFQKSWRLIKNLIKMSKKHLSRSSFNCVPNLQSSILVYLHRYFSGSSFTFC